MKGEKRSVVSFMSTNLSETKEVVYDFLLLVRVSPSSESYGGNVECFLVFKLAGNIYFFS